MQPLPHRYVVRARSEWGGSVIVDADGLPSLKTDTPREFGGPGNQWSPEALFVAAVADCFVLTFRGLARVRGLAWREVSCVVEGTLDRVDRITQFTDVRVKVRLTVPDGTSRELARGVLERAEETCLVARSLKARAHLDAEVEIEPTVEPVPVDSW